MMGRVVHFELPAADPDRAASFYRTVFGWEITPWEGPLDYRTVSTGPESEPGIHGGIAPKGDQPSPGVTVTIAVTSVDQTLKDITSSGGRIVVLKTVIPGVGYLARFMDPEGNVVGIIENNPEAGIVPG